MIISRRAAATALALACAASCRTYTRGSSFLGAESPGSEARYLDCIDIAVRPVEDPHADRDDPVFEFRFGNRCGWPVTLDLGAVVVRAEVGTTIAVLPPYRICRAAWRSDRSCLCGCVRYQHVDGGRGSGAGMFRSPVADDLGGALAMTVHPSALIALAVLVAASDALARPCGRSIRGPTSRVQHRERCLETSDVVGRRRCSRFGNRWDIARLPELAFEAVAAVTSVGADSVPMVEAARSTTTGAEPRLAIHCAGVRGVYTSDDRETYIAAEVLVGFGSEATSAQRVMMVHGAVALGVLVRLGRLRVRPELAVGIRHVELVLEPTSCGCMDTGPSTKRVIASPRLALEWRLTPGIGVAAFGGVDVLDRGNAIAGLGMTFSPWSRGF